jgi:hypothetical protein
MHADSLAGVSLAGGSLARKTEKVTKRTPSTVNRPMQATTPRQKKKRSKHPAALDHANIFHGRRQAPE